MIFDKAFIIKLKSCDGKTQKAFYQQLAPKMYGICLRFAGSTEEADDILQEGFIRVFNHLKDFRGEGSLEGWVRRTIINTAINIYKKRIKQGKKTELENIREKNEDNLYIIEKMAADELIEVIRELPDGYRAVFNLNIIEGYTHKEIGEMLEISENTSKSQLSRARKSLQKKLNALKEKEKKRIGKQPK
ncbi:MAG TPA: RNA polymerase sigma factor [Bacteroidetes bacterium]|nr:RNA polymerase sigma factor [Bacteroidota bacterium]